MSEVNQNLEQLENKLQALKEFSASHGVDLNKEIKAIEEKIHELKIEAYRNLSPWDKVIWQDTVKDPQVLIISMKYLRIL